MRVGREAEGGEGGEGDGSSWGWLWVEIRGDVSLGGLVDGEFGFEDGGVDMACMNGMLWYVSCDT